MKKNKFKGAVLINVLLAFVVTMIVVTGIFFVLQQNTMETVRQLARIQAYYLSLSGVELAMGALEQEEALPNGDTITLLERYKNDPSKGPLTDSFDLGKGKVDIHVKRDARDGEVWVEITSIAELESNDRVKVKNIGKVRVNTANPAMMEWNVKVS